MNKPTRIKLSFLLLALITACNQTEPGPATRQEMPGQGFFGQNYPGSTPALFSPDLLSTPRNERDIAISPDGKEIFYSYVLPGFNLSAIITLKHDGAFWSSPDVAFFSGIYNDLEPAFSPGGDSLFFVSKRPVHDNDSTSDWNIWFIERPEGPWKVPVVLGPPVNDEANSFYPSVAANGNLYFTAGNREGNMGGEDIYYCANTNGSYSSPVNLGPGVNTGFSEFNAYVSPDERFLIFSSQGRQDDLGGGDLYISFRDAGGIWQPAKHMGPEINSGKLDYSPFVTHNGKLLFFTSQRMDHRITDRNKKNFLELMRLEESQANGLGNIYWVEFDASQWQ